MEKIESCKPIDPTKIKSPSVARRMSTNSCVLGGRGQFMLRLVRILQFSIHLEIDFLFSLQARQNASPKNLINVIKQEAVKTPERSQEVTSNLVKFSDKKHNPDASPSNSILSKRKCPDSITPLSAKVRQ